MHRESPGSKMRSTIYKTVVLPAPPAELYDMYMDAETHAAFTGAPCRISEEPGSAFEAFGGLLNGTTLQAVKPMLIVQSWRSVNFAMGRLYDMSEHYFQKIDSIKCPGDFSGASQTICAFFANLAAAIAQVIKIGIQNVCRPEGFITTSLLFSKTYKLSSRFFLIDLGLFRIHVWRVCRSWQH